MTLSAARKKQDQGITRRFVSTSVVSERTLPYNIQAIDTPDKIHRFWMDIITSEPDYEADKESVCVVMVNTYFKPFAWNRVSIGTINETPAHPREILRPVIACAAYSFVLMHNHPSGDPSPSGADTNITSRIVSASEILGVRMTDHVIIGRPSPGRLPYYSFREAGLI